MNPSYIAANWTPEIWKYRKYQHAFPYATCFNTEKIQGWRYLANLNHSKQLAYVFPQYNKKNVHRFPGLFLDSKVKSKLLLKKFFGVNDVFNTQDKARFG